MPYTRLRDDSNSNGTERRFRENYDSINFVGNGSLSTKEKKSDDFSCYIYGSSPEEKYKAIGYKQSIFWLILYYLTYIPTFGLTRLFVYWRPDWRVKFTNKKCPISQAEELILIDTDGIEFIAHVETEDFDGYIPEEYNISTDCSGPKGSVQHFTFQYLKYFWNKEKQTFECYVGLARNVPVSSLLKDYRGYSEETQGLRLRLFGSNHITTKVKSYWKLFITEILHFFYIFQIWALLLWSLDGYYLYAICIFIVSCLSMMVSLFETKRQSENVKNMVEATNANTVLVLREPGAMSHVEENSVNIVPGDVIAIPATGGIMACDAVLISGTAIVNESMLTGESVPVTKTSLTPSDEGEIYSPEIHKRHTLFCGTNVVQTRYYGNEQVLAVVVRTGFSTAKGELIRSILYPRSIVFNFYDASMKFIKFMFVLSSLGMAYSLYVYISRHESWVTTLLRTCDIITIVVPPALPAAMTVGTYYAQNRLKKLGIFCISPPRINVCGKLKLVCFDKTGTLTEDGLNVWGVVGVEKDIQNGSLHLGTPCHQVDLLNSKTSLMAGLASCHSLTYINGKLTGDPLDIQMFESTKWGIVEPEKETEIFDSLIPTIVRPPARILFSPHEKQIIALNVLRDNSNIRSRGTGSVPESFEGVANFDKDTEPLLNVSDGENDVDEVDNPQKLQQPCVTVEQILEESIDDSGMSTTVIKSFLCQTFESEPRFINVAETAFKVPYEIGIVRQFPFSSAMQRMSVIVRVLGRSHMELYSKGAPEVIQNLCHPETVPVNFSSVLNQFTLQGFRVIALAHKNLESKLSWHTAQRVKRNIVESDMTFLGLLILQNVLKPETAPVIAKLKAADIRSVMITGDNILTGICVARDCGMVYANENVLLAKVIKDENDDHFLAFETAHSGGLEDALDLSQDKNTHITIDKEDFYHLAITGNVWTQIKEHFPLYIPYIVSQGTIFARMSPEQKVQVVEELQQLNYVVGMCGDGANDCGALKAAHVGISLSEAEASVAAPFTSRIQNITCVPTLICEGRGALTTNFSVFKFMALYSIIQFVSVLILYTACTNLSDPQFLYIDLFMVTSIAIFMGYTEANHTLVRQRPLSNLIGFVNMFSILVQIALVIIFQVFAYMYLKMQPWYNKPNDCSGPNSGNIVKTWETNVIFYISSLQYLILAIIFSPGRPFRKPLYTNICLIVTIVLLFSISLWFLLYPIPFVEMLMQLLPFPGDLQFIFRVTLFMIAALHFVLGWSVEYFIAESKTLKKIFQWLSRKKQPKNLYKRVRNQIKRDAKWPPIDEPIYKSTTS